MRWWFCRAHRFSSTPLRRNCQIRTGHLRLPPTPLVNLTVFGHVRFRLRETCFFTVHFLFFCNVFVAEFCSGASKKYWKHEKLQWCLKKVLMWGGWDMAERWKHTKSQMHVHFLPQCTWQKTWTCYFLFFMTHQNMRSRPREITGSASATTPHQKSSN